MGNLDQWVEPHICTPWPLFRHYMFICGLITFAFYLRFVKILSHIRLLIDRSVGVGFTMYLMFVFGLCGFIHWMHDFSFYNQYFKLVAASLYPFLIFCMYKLNSISSDKSGPFKEVMKFKEKINDVNR